MTEGPPRIYVPVCPPTRYCGPLRYKRVDVVGECPLIASGTPPLAEREPELAALLKAERVAIDNLRRIGDARWDEQTSVS